MSSLIISSIGLSLSCESTTAPLDQSPPSCHEDSLKQGTLPADVRPDLSYPFFLLVGNRLFLSGGQVSTVDLASGESLTIDADWSSPPPTRVHVLEARNGSLLVELEGEKRPVKLRDPSGTIWSLAERLGVGAPPESARSINEDGRVLVWDSRQIVGFEAGEVRSILETTEYQYAQVDTSGSATTIIEDTGHNSRILAAMNHSTFRELSVAASFGVPWSLISSGFIYWTHGGPVTRTELATSASELVPNCGDSVGAASEGNIVIDCEGGLTIFRGAQILRTIPRHAYAFGVCEHTVAWAERSDCADGTNRGSIFAASLDLPETAILKVGEFRDWCTHANDPLPVSVSASDHFVVWTRGISDVPAAEIVAYSETPDDWRCAGK